MLNKLLKEINEIPEKADKAFNTNKNISLPNQSLYLGMGSSYFAALTLYFCGAKIKPEIASEYFYYLSDNSRRKNKGVLISQSGESSETVWCMDRFKETLSIINDPSSTLGKSDRVVNIYAGEEKMSSTKSYINTLITLYQGLGFDVQKAIRRLHKNFDAYSESAEKHSIDLKDFIDQNAPQSYFVIGSGPNLGSAYQVALVLSETTKLSWQGMSVAQYDHGPKETAENSVVLILNSKGKDSKRIEYIKSILLKKNTKVLEINEEELEENISPITIVTQANLFMYYLGCKLKVKKTFQLGGKVTKVSESIK